MSPRGPRTPRDLSALGAEPPSGGRRAITVLLALVLIGLPILVAVDLSSLRENAPAFRGNQPGGTVRGRVIDGEGSPLEGLVVELFVTGRGSGPLATATTDSDGRWSLTAPPAEGAAYRLRTGGGPWQVRNREIGFLRPDGEVVGQVLEQELVLVPGATLVLHLGAEGEVAPPGTVRLRGEWREQGLLRVAPRLIELERPFEGSPIVLDGLPPLVGTVDLELSGGRVISFDVELEVGEKTQRVPL